MKLSKSLIRGILGKFKGLKVLLVGDAIIDDYYFVTPNGISIKDPIISTQFIRKERYLGGVFATARHLSQFVKEVNVITLLGEKKKNKEFIEKSIPQGVKYSYFTKPGAYTTIKERFIDSYKLVKLFKMEYLDDSPVPDDLSRKIIEKIRSVYGSYDMILINDFGHGFINQEIMDSITGLNKFIGANIQTKNSNYGFNPVTKCKKADFISLNPFEIRLVFQNKDDDFETLLRRLAGLRMYKDILLTLGKNGAMFYRSKINSAPAFEVRPIDTIGAGDAVFAVGSLLSFSKTDEEIIPVISNAAGAAATQYVGNKDIVTLDKILKYF